MRNLADDGGIIWSVVKEVQYPFANIHLSSLVLKPRMLTSPISFMVEIVLNAER